MTKQTQPNRPAQQHPDQNRSAAPGRQAKTPPSRGNIQQSRSNQQSPRDNRDR